MVRLLSSSPTSLSASMSSANNNNDNNNNMTSSPAEISKQIKFLLKEVPEIRADATRLDELRRLFTKLEANGEISFGGTTPLNSTAASFPNPVTAKWQTFLHQSHKQMVTQLLERVSLGRHSSIRCLWGVIAGSPRTSSMSSSLSKDQNGNTVTPTTYKYVNIDLLQKWIRAMTIQQPHDEGTMSYSTSSITANNTTTLGGSSMDKAMKHMLEVEFLRPFRDVQYYSLCAITNLATVTYNNCVDHDERRQKKQKNNTPKQDKDNDDGGSDAPLDTDYLSNSTIRVAERLVELLLMIPVPASQEELDSSQFLFPPPRNSIPEKDSDEEDDENDASENDEDSNDDLDSDDDESKNDDNNNNNNNRPTKRQKTEQQNKLAFQQMRMFRKEYQKAWLAVLRLPLSIGHLKKALHFLPTNVLHYGRAPLRFADFFMQAYSDNDSGIVGIMALDGLFILITEYGLEYPNFYKQLYRLVSSRVLYVKYRTRFFSLLNKCLARNEMLPAHIVAAFVKRLCRSALSGPPPGALFVLALVSNLLRKHPECNALLQRNTAVTEQMEDPYVPDEDDPVQCRALQSSLWELAVFERHYYPAVATIAKSIGTAEEGRAPFYVVEDFASHTFTSFFEQEKKTNKGTKTPLTFTEPTSLFTNDDVFSDCFRIGQ